MSKIIRLVDRTRTVQDWKCPRSRYWGYEYLGRGLSKEGTALELFIGIVTHDAMAAIATFTKEGQPVPIDEIAGAAFTQVRDIIQEGSSLPENQEFAIEQGTLIEGMIRGFYKHVWPRLMAQYPKIIAIEAEMEYPLGSTDGFDFLFMTKPDLIVEDQAGEWVYLEYKTTSWKKEGWINSWETAVQLHSSIKAVEKTLGKLPAYVQIVGLYKGYESYGKQSSPFCYAYKKYGNPPFTQEQIQYEYKAGFRRTPTWEMPGGVKAWIEGMPENILADQFPLTPQILINEDLVNAFFAQRLTREDEIARAATSTPSTSPYESIRSAEKAWLLNAFFPQKFDQCVPSFGKPCVFKKLCHGQVEDPLTEGYELRTPHHDRELLQLNSLNPPRSLREPYDA